jgi:hypothetical protein
MPVPEDKRETLLRYLRVQRVTDAELRRLLNDAARAMADAVLRDAPRSFSDSLRRAFFRQHAAAISRSLWNDIGHATTDGQRRAALRAIEGADFDLKSLLRGLPPDVASALIDSTRAGARLALDRAIARLGGRNQIVLAQSVYRNTQLMDGTIDRLINSGIARGLSAREMAAEVRRFILPNVRGGVSYAAMRLGRTELNNSYHSASVAYWSDSPFVPGMQWNLSGSHPKADICNEYADEDHERLGRGVFSTLNVPPKPHPQCLCYVVPQSLSDDEIVRKMNRGDFDGFLRANGIAA